MEKKKLQLIINPISGTRNKRGLDKYVRKRLEPKGFEVDVAWTSCRGDATRIAREAVANGYDIVVAAGGDGTINETARALCGTDVAFGIIPCGSGNGLARHLGIPADTKTAVSVIENGNVTKCDYATVNDTPFFCTFGAGFDAAVSEKFARSKKRGKLTYIKNTFTEFFKYKPQEYSISINGEEVVHKAFLVAVCNASQYGNNAYIAPMASITDGMLDVTVVHRGGILSTALVGMGLMTGLIDKNTHVDTFRASEVVITRSGEGPIHMDGEPLIYPEVLKVKCVPQALKIVTKRADGRIIPILTPICAMMSDVRYSIRHLFHRF